jgi:hypothetical protein
MQSMAATARHLNALDDRAFSWLSDTGLRNH